MKITNRKAVFLVTGFVVLVILVLIINRWILSDDDSLIPSASDNTDTHWTWTNPVTAGEVAIPSVWQKTEDKVNKEALLTLTHNSGKSLIYMVYETSSENMSLSEYAGGAKNSLQKGLGIDQFELRDEEYRFYEAEGAELFGEVVAETRVRIWSDKGNRFWQAVVITDQDYRDLEYEAREIVDSLMETTL